MDYIKKCLKHTRKMYVLILITLLYSLLIGWLYSFKYFNLGMFLLNTLVFLFSLIVSIAFDEFFFFTAVKFIQPRMKAKEAFIITAKSILLAYCILLPTVMVMLSLNCFFRLNAIYFTRVNAFIMSYICCFILFFTYKFISNENWKTTVSIVSVNILLRSLVMILMSII